MYWGWFVAARAAGQSIPPAAENAADAPRKARRSISVIASIPVKAVEPHGQAQHFRQRPAQQLQQLTRLDADRVELLPALGRLQGGDQRVGLRFDSGDEPRQAVADGSVQIGASSEEHTFELQSLMRTSYAAFCLQ